MRGWCSHVHFHGGRGCIRTALFDGSGRISTVGRRSDRQWDSWVRAAGRRYVPDLRRMVHRVELSRKGSLAEGAPAIWIPIFRCDWAVLERILLLVRGGSRPVPV